MEPCVGINKESAAFLICTQHTQMWYTETPYIDTSISIRLFAFRISFFFFYLVCERIQAPTISCSRRWKTFPPWKIARWEFPISWSTRERERESRTDSKSGPRVIRGKAGIEEKKKTTRRRRRGAVQHRGTCAFVSVTIARNMCATLLSPLRAASVSSWWWRRRRCKNRTSRQQKKFTPAEKIDSSARGNSFQMTDSKSKPPQ